MNSKDKPKCTPNSKASRRTQMIWFKKSSHCIKTEKLNFTQIKSFYSPKNTENEKTKKVLGENICKSINFTKDKCLKCTKNSQNSTIRT